MHKIRVELDLQSGLESGIQGTPELFINEVRDDGALKLVDVMKAKEIGSR